ncbi:MAG: sulfurtransferase [Thiobacillaceae bacterium]
MRHTVRKTLLVVMLGLGTGALPLTGLADTQPVMLAKAHARIIDTAAVQAAIARGAIVWDVRSAEDYRKGHIPGAVNIGDISRTLRREVDEDFISLEQMARLLGSVGLDPAREIVIYGDKGSAVPYFGLYTMEYLNGRRASVYHGGIDDWKAAGLALSTQPPQPTPVNLQLTVNPQVAVSTDYVLASLKRPDVQIVDVRTLPEFKGEDVRALRGGHIPGAVNIPYEQGWVDPDTPSKLARRQVNSKDGMALKAVDKLRELYARLDPAKETIVYCQSGVRAAQTAGVLKELGFANVKVYDGSWLAYGNTLDAPAENLRFFNVGAMQARVNALQRRLETLEGVLAELQAKSAPREAKP